MNFLARLVISSLAVILASRLLPGVHLDGYIEAVIVAAVLSLLNILLKPLLIILTIPFTIVTFGLFLLVINAVIIMIADTLIDSFHVEGFWWALLFSLILSLIQTVFESIASEKPRNN